MKLITQINLNKYEGYSPEEIVVDIANKFKGHIIYKHTREQLEYYIHDALMNAGYSLKPIVTQINKNDFNVTFKEL